MLLADGDAVLELSDTSVTVMGVNRADMLAAIACLNLEEKLSPSRRPRLDISSAHSSARAREPGGMMVSRFRSMFRSRSIAT